MSRRKMPKDAIFFLGTAGGASGTALKFQKTAGTLVCMSGAVVWIDPGPGASQSFFDYGFSVEDIDAVCVSEVHIDHFHDTPVVIDNLAYFASRKKEAVAVPFFMPRQCCGEGGLSAYHQSLVPIRNVENGGRYAVGDIRIETYGGWMKELFYRDDIEEYSYVLEGSSVRIGYSTEMKHDGAVHSLPEVDILIQSFTSPQEDAVQRICAVIRASRPHVVILRHWMRGSWEYGIDRVVSWVQKECGVPTVAARDGFLFDISRMRMVSGSEER